MLGSKPGKVVKPSASYPHGDDDDDDDDEDKPKGGRLRGKKVDVRGLMKRRVTSGRAPSMTRKSSADHTHDEHDHDHGGHVSLAVASHQLLCSTSFNYLD